jgi:hypothetical protein
LKPGSFLPGIPAHLTACDVSLVYLRELGWISAFEKAIGLCATTEDSQKWTLMVLALMSVPSVEGVIVLGRMINSCCYQLVT